MTSLRFYLIPFLMDYIGWLDLNRYLRRTRWRVHPDYVLSRN